MTDKIDFDFIMSDELEYNNLLDEISELLLKKNITNRLNKITVVIDNKEVEMTLGRLYINMLMLYLLLGKGIHFTYDMIIHEEHLTPNVQARVFNMLLDKADEVGISIDECEEKLANTINIISDVFSTVNRKVGATPAILDFIKLEATDPAARRIMNIELKSNLQYDEVENIFNTLSVLFLKTLSMHPEIGFTRFVTPGSGVNLKQSTQSFCMGGLKPDTDGSIINYAIENSYYHGLKSDIDYFIDAKGTRKALITNHEMVSVAGYLNQKLTLLMMDTTLDEEIDDCGTKHVVIYDIKNEKYLNFINDRYYYHINDDGTVDYSQLYYVNTANAASKSLIGKKIALRSPQTCGCTHNNSKSKVCRKCYGKKLYELNKNKHAGIIAVLFLMDILTQMLLSAKHLLTTRAQKINWPNVIKNYFDISFDTLCFNNEAEIKIDIDDISDNNWDDDREAYSICEFDITINDDKTHVVSPIPLYINPILTNIDDILLNGETASIHINSNNMSEECDYIFNFEQDNSELSTPLMNIINILDTTDHLGYESYEEIINKIADLLIESDINSKIQLVHLEMIIRELIVYANNNEHIDWLNDGNPTYSILRVSRAVLNKPLSISLSFERIGTQLAELKTFSKDSVSIYDEIYR